MANVAMSSPQPRPVVPDHEPLPTITLAPPPGLKPSHSIHVASFMLAPLVISGLVCIVTVLYLIKLWQREDKFFVDEVYDDEEESSGGEEAEAKSIFIPSVISKARPTATKILTQAQRMSGGRRWVSKPFDIRKWTQKDDQAYEAARLAAPVQSPVAATLPPPRPVHTPAFGRTFPIVGSKPSLTTPSPPAPPLPVSSPRKYPLPNYSLLTSPNTTGTTFPYADDARSYKSTQSWEHDSSAASLASTSIYSTSSDNLAGPSSQSPIDERFGTQPSSPSTARHPDMSRLSAQSRNSDAESEATETQSRIHWHGGNGGSTTSSIYTASDSQFDRGSMSVADRWEDY